MPEETLAALAPKPGGLYLDGTLGLGGHSTAILESAPDTQVCGLDCDAEALSIAGDRLEAYAGRVHLFQRRFGAFATALSELGWEKVDGALLDLGVSSLQLDEGRRGFSFRNQGPLDMRMDPDSGAKSAWHMVNKESFNTLKECIATLGEEPQAGRIARLIVEERQKAPIDDTLRLAEIVCRAYPPAWRGNARRHPATRTFQALRMAVNDELGQIRQFLNDIMAWLPVGGRLAILTFHSLEDRMVKRAMRRWAQGCICSKQNPTCVCNHRPEVRILYKKPLTASQSELDSNPRAGSAKLRAVEKIAENNDNTQQVT